VVKSTGPYRVIPAGSAGIQVPGMASLRENRGHSGTGKTWSRFPARSCLNWERPLVPHFGWCCECIGEMFASSSSDSTRNIKRNEVLGCGEHSEPHHDWVTCLAVDKRCREVTGLDSRLRTY